MTQQQLEVLLFWTAFCTTVGFLCGYFLARPRRRP
jgi:hypothetical protein